MEEELSPAERVTTSVSGTRSGHCSVYIGSNGLNEVKCMTAVVIIGVPGNGKLRLSK